MFLKSLTLRGFKSFADSTVLEMEPGVTVVVGPNGSGKSNVVDAIAWVLGAQAPSAVRSQKMEDVIFSGTNKRTALGRAEVILTLDNSAGLLSLDFNEITIGRTLFRNGDSEYAINGVECRLLDVQELLSDAGVGRQQHVIMSQGQIDKVLTARAEERREIIEEAAGVLKYRKRKEKAERRLEATEANLLRVQDLIREVRRQLRPLERQADAARRHGEIVAELRALRMFLSGREVASLRTQLAALAGDKTSNDAAERDLRDKLATLDTEVVAAEADLSARGQSGLSDEMLRVEQLRERARGLLALMAERRRSLERDQGQMVADDVVAAIEADAAAMRVELDEVERNLGIAHTESTALSVEESEFERERTEQGLLHVVDGAEVANAAAEVRGELRSMRNTLEAGAGELRRLTERIAALEVRETDLGRAVDDLQRALADAETSLGSARVSAASADDARDAADDAMDQAHVRVASAERDHARATAHVERVEAADAPQRARATGGHLAAVAGVVGALIDSIEIEEGWDAAVRAALSGAVAAVLVEDSGAAERALDALRDASRNGTVIPLDAARSAPLHEGSVRGRVRSARTDVGVLLDGLLAGVVVAADAAEAARHLAAGASAVVTRAGDRFSPDGWTAGAADDAGSADVVAAARDRARGAETELASAREALGQSRRALVSAKTTSAASVAEVERHVTHMDAVSERLTGAVGERRAAITELTIARESLEGIRARVASASARVAELETILPGLEESEAAEIAAVRAQTEARHAIDAKASHLVMRRQDLEVRRAGLGERRQFLADRLAEAERRLAADSDARNEAGARRELLQRSFTALDRIATLVEGHRSAADARLGELQDARRRQSEEVRAVAARLDASRRSRHDTERELEVLRERIRRVDIGEAEARTRLEAAVETIRRDLDVEPEEAERAPAPETPDGSSHSNRARALERDIRLMGPINPLALQEFTELQARHQFLDDQLNDVRRTRRELSQVIAVIDTEIKSVFAAAFADVSRNFTELFQLLFPGGRGRLTLTNPDDLLSTGIEVEATPPGKNLKKLSLLSGGEKSLTALAYLFAVFRSRPSPFYVMDEVEAALDDPNLHRFLGLVREFRQEAQLIIVSHQKRTMEAADCLMGVSMQPGGSSKVVVEHTSPAPVN